MIIIKYIFLYIHSVPVHRSRKKRTNMADINDLITDAKFWILIIILFLLLELSLVVHIKYIEEIYKFVKCIKFKNKNKNIDIEISTKKQEEDE